MDSEWTCAENVEAVSEILSENIEDDYFEEAVIDIDQNKVSLDEKKEKIKDIFGSKYNKNNDSAKEIVEFLPLMIISEEYRKKNGISRHLTR